MGLGDFSLDYNYDYANLGGQSSPIVPGLNNTYEASQPAPPIIRMPSKLEASKERTAGIWNAFYETVEEAPHTSAVALSNDLSNVTSAGQSVVGGALSIVSPAIMTILGVVVVLGAVIYFVGKSGAIGQASAFMPGK